MTTPRPTEETFVEKGEVGESNSYENGKSLELPMAYTVLLMMNTVLRKRVGGGGGCSLCMRQKAERQGTCVCRSTKR
jgi:hypothetical protein